jgi:quinol monooxygenase YgiN
MTTVALNIRLEARPGKEDDVADLLRRGRAMVDAEPATVAWFGVQLGPSTFGIFDAFPDESGRTTHLAGQLGTELMERADELFTQAPVIEEADVLADKVPPK